MRDGTPPDFSDGMGDRQPEYIGQMNVASSFDLLPADLQPIPVVPFRDIVKMTPPMKPGVPCFAGL